MKNTIIASIVAIICTVSICVTYAAKSPSNKKDTSAYSSAYMTETEAAEYIGVDEEIMKIMRVNLKSFDGAFVTYYYTDSKGNEVENVVYQKDALDKAVEKIMKDQGALNFKYLQEAAKNSK